MKPYFPRPKALRGFSLIEILVVVTIIAVLIAILIPVTAKVLTNARLNAACSEVINLRQLASEAATRLGGTLPLTEGITNMNQVSIDATLRQWLGSENDAGRIFHLNGLLSLDNVFMSMSPPMMDNYYVSSFGRTVVRNIVNPPLRYNSETGDYTARALTGTNRYRAWTDGLGDSSRIECAPVLPTFVQNQVVNTVGGVNFRLDGVNLLPAGRCVYMVYENVPMAEAYELSKRLNPAPLLNGPGFNALSQTRGRVIYHGGGTPTTRVYVYLANF
jgi:prepilin-type N-terminal cleavage/methylation domain-containing protein